METQLQKNESDIDSKIIKSKVTLKTKLALASVGAFALLLIAGAGAFTHAATTNTNASTFLDRVAQIAGVDASKLKSAVSQTSTEQIDQKLAAGEITQEQATKMKEDITGGNFLVGMRGHGGPRGGGMMFLTPDKFASFVGLTVDQLETKEHTDGQTWLEIAKAQGKTEDQLKTYLSEQFDKGLADDVSSGKITQVQSDKMKADKDNFITRFINDVHKVKGGPRPETAPFFINSTSPTN